jgi:mannose-6-phosphate isomerase-like protein (cupin superfamily)
MKSCQPPATLVKKHWGHETWLSNDGRYALKRILFLGGHRTSLQVHQFKHETNHVISGTGKLYYSEDVFDINKFLENGMTSKEVEEYEKTLSVLDLEPGVTFIMHPGQVHRVVALTDLEFIEASSPELDDVFRLQDDQGRTHGRISYEHE